MAEFGLIRPFGIDHGELDGLRPQECFVLGYELAMIDQILETGSAVRRPVHAKNSERISEACRKVGRKFKLTWAPDDASEEWMQLDVEAA